MKKAILKILVTGISLTLIISLQAFIKNFFNIDNRIWFFPQFFGGSILLMIICYNFGPEYETTKQYLKENGLKGLIKPFNKLFSKIGNVLLRIFKNKIVRAIYSILRTVVTLTVFTGVAYQAFFIEDFKSRFVLVVLFSILFVVYFLMYLCEYIFDKSRRTKTNRNLCALTGIAALVTILKFFI